MLCRVNEVYPCILGEALPSGLTALLIRFNGCNLACPYCDSPYSREEAGVERSVEDLLLERRDSGLSRVLLSGGEPLCQPEPARLLMHRLLEDGVEVFLETNGTLPIRDVPSGVARILDVKVPSARPGVPFLLDNLAVLTDRDQLKFVLSDWEDYRYALGFLKRHGPSLPDANVLFSPAAPGMSPVLLAERMLRDRLPYRFQLQIHKVLWGDRRGV